MSYNVVSEILNITENKFKSINEFNKWYCATYPSKKSGKSIPMTIEDCMDQMSVSKTWNEDKQVATIIRTYKSKERYHHWEELFLLSGNERHLEKVVDEYID